MSEYLNLNPQKQCKNRNTVVCHHNTSIKKRGQADLSTGLAKSMTFN